MKRFLLCALALLPAVLLAGPPPETFVAIIRHAMDSSASWKMSKRIADPGLTLESSGFVHCWHGHGIIWETREPFMQVIRMTTNEMAFVSENDTRTKPLSELPHYTQIRERVDRFLAGDDESFSSDFKWIWTPGTPWRMEITPRRSEMGRFIKTLTLTGGAALENVVLQYASGDSATISFAELPKPDRALFSK